MHIHRWDWVRCPFQLGPCQWWFDTWIGQSCLCRRSSYTSCVLILPLCLVASMVIPRCVIGVRLTGWENLAPTLYVIYIGCRPFDRLLTTNTFFLLCLVTYNIPFRYFKLPSHHLLFWPLVDFTSLLNPDVLRSIVCQISLFACWQLRKRHTVRLVRDSYVKESGRSDNGNLTTY